MWSGERFICIFVSCSLVYPSVIFVSLLSVSTKVKQRKVIRGNDDLFVFLMQRPNYPHGVYEFPMNPHVPFLFPFVFGPTDGPCSYCGEKYSTVHVGVYRSVYHMKKKPTNAAWNEHSSKHRDMRSDRMFLLVHDGRWKIQYYNVAQCPLLRHSNV